MAGRSAKREARGGARRVAAAASACRRVPRRRAAGKAAGFPWILSWILVQAGVGALPSAARAQAPDADYRTITTEHFHVTFPAGMEALGRRSAERAEAAWRHLDRTLPPAPEGRVELLITDHTDVSNGFARVTPSNRVVVFAAPPVDDPNLGYFDDWLELVITHELAHIYHLDRTGTLGSVLRAVFGRVSAQWPYYPTAAAPRWTIEGLATWYESQLTDAGRRHGTFHVTQLRTAVLEGRFEELDQASGDSPVWPSGSRAYIYGSLFFDWLTETYGEERMAAFADAVAGQWVPYRLDSAAEDAFGVSFSEAWEAWTELWRARTDSTLAALGARGPITVPEPVTDGARLALYPRVSADGGRLAYVRADGRSDLQLRISDPAGGESAKLMRTNGLATYDWLPDGRLVLAQLDLHGPYRSYGDLYLVSPDGDAARLTDGLRLSHPAASPDGRWAVAMQTSPGTTHLVRVDLATGEVRDLVQPDPDQHWTFPAVSPDGRWVAASRWRSGAYLDVVVLDAATGELAVEVTADRALDLAPAWSPDGRWLVWGSDRTGVQNLLAAEVEPARGFAGPVRQATNVTTAVAYPEVGPDGRWIWVSGYHADGWDVERVPFDPASWPAAPPPVPLFDAPAWEPPPPGPGARAEVQDYDPLRSLRPYYWEPRYEEAQRSPAIVTGDVTLRSRELLGPSIGAATSGADLVGRHAFSASARVYTRGAGSFDGGVAYSFRGLGNPLLSLSASQGWNEDGPRLARSAEDAPLDTLFVVERRRRIAGAVTVLRPAYRSDLSLRLDAGHVWEHRELLDNALEPTESYRLTRPDARLADAALSLVWSNVRSYSFALGAARGASLFVRGRRALDLALPDSLQGVAGVDRSLDEVIGRLRLFTSFDGPGFGPHVVGVRGSFGAARGPDADPGHFDVGGSSGAPEPISGLELFGGSSLFFPLRGYRTNVRFGRYAWSASAEYRVPLLSVHQGLGAWPLYLDRVIGTVFFDAGNAWGPDLAPGGFENPRRAALASVGGELAASLLTFWTEGLLLRGGVGVPLVEGDGVRGWLRVGLAF